MHELLWFLGGALFYKIISHLLNVGHSVLFMQEVQVRALLILMTAVQDVAFMKKIKYDTMRESLPEKEVEKTKQIDEQAFESWKASTLNKLQNNLPPSLQRRSFFISWPKAIAAVEEEYKNQLKM